MMIDPCRDDDDDLKQKHNVAKCDLSTEDKRHAKARNMLHFG